VGGWLDLGFVLPSGVFHYRYLRSVRRLLIPGMAIAFGSAERARKFAAERKEAGVGREEPLIGRNRHNRDVDEVCLVRDRKPIDPDAALVERLRHREEAAVTALVAAHGDRVYRLAIQLTGNSSDAEEVMQDAFWSATRRIDSFRGTAAFLSWLYRITLDSAYQKLRGWRRSSRVQRARRRLPC
jgi:hypothetical protein